LGTIRHAGILAETGSATLEANFVAGPLPLLCGKSRRRRRHESKRDNRKKQLRHLLSLLLVPDPDAT